MSSSDEDRVERGDEGATSEDEEEWPFWKLALIALPQMGVMVLWIFLGPNTTPYLEYLGASKRFAVLNNSAGPIVGFVVGPIVGSWSDQSTSRWGRRRPIIVAGLLSTLIAGVLYSGAKQILQPHEEIEKGQGGSAMYLAAVMQWVLDFTINAMQTPFRALVSDLSSKRQQFPLQIFFSIVCALGCFLAFSIIKVYDVAFHHMLELMGIIMLINFVCVGIALLVAKEKQHVPKAGGEGSAGGFMATMRGMCGACNGMPKAFYILLGVQCMVWLGNTVWGSYGEIWFTHSVYSGNPEAPKDSIPYTEYTQGESSFASAGQIGSVFNLLISFAFMGLAATTIPKHYIYAPCIFVGAFVCFMCAFVVGHSHLLAVLMFVLSNLALTAAGSLPYGIVAVWNRAAEEAGHEGSVAMQMAVLNCCITVGQQLCTMTYGGLVGSFSEVDALRYLYTASMIANFCGGVGAMALGTGTKGKKEVATTDSDEASSSEAESS